MKVAKIYLNKSLAFAAAAAARADQGEPILSVKHDSITPVEPPVEPDLGPSNRHERRAMQASQASQASKRRRK